MWTRRCLLGAAPALGLASGARAQPARSFPSRPVRLVVPLTAGGSLDALARLVGTRLSERWNQPVLVENRTGANGMIAAAAVANAADDGHTLLFTHSAIVQNAAMQPNAPYRMEQLLPVQRVVELPVALGIQVSLGSTLADLVRAARARPGEIAYGSFGHGSSGHVMGELLERHAQIQMVHVPFRGGADATTAMLGGTVSAIFSPAGLMAEHPNRIAIVGVSGPQRLTRFPQVPTFDEAGLPLQGLTGWCGVFAASTTPPAHAAEIARALRQVVALPEVVNATLDFGFEPSPDTGEPFEVFVRAQVERWTEVVRELGLRPS